MRRGESQSCGTGNRERRCGRATVPLALRAVGVVRPVRLSPLLRPQSPSAMLLLLQRLLRQKGGVHPAPLAEAAARPPALPAHACFVLAPAATSRAESGCAMTASVLAGAASAQRPRLQDLSPQPGFRAFSGAG